MEKRKFCGPLPDPYYSEFKEEPTTATKFFEERVCESDRREITNEFKKTLVLEKQKSKLRKVKNPRISKKQLTAREKRDLGLNRLPKVGLKYEQFKELHELWTSYMNDLLDIKALTASGWKPDNLEDPKIQQLQIKICRSDFHGAKLKVDKADCPTQVGRQGICLLETRHTLQIISIDNKLRMIPKRGTTFSLEVGGFKFSFPGSAMLTKPADRATKKPKMKMPLDF